MELALSLGDASTPFTFLDHKTNASKMSNKDLGFCMALGSSFVATRPEERKEQAREDQGERRTTTATTTSADHHQPVQLDLLPLVPVPRCHQTNTSQFRFPWLTDNSNTPLLII